MFEVIYTERFKNDVKYYVRKKKFLNIQEDIKNITDELEKGNLLGDELQGIKLSNSSHTYKVRVANTDTKSGKSNGYRIIYYAVKDNEIVYLLTIYYKKEDKNIPTDKEIIGIIEEYCI